MSNYEIIYIITIFIKMKENIFIYFYISIHRCFFLFFGDEVLFVRSRQGFGTEVALDVKTFQSDLIFQGNERQFFDSVKGGRSID